MSVESLLIELPLSGERSYVHGVDIFDAVIARTGATADVALVLRTATDCAIELVDPPAAALLDPEVFGSIRYRIDGNDQRRALRRRRDRPITTRLPLDESDVTRGATYGNDRALVPRGTHSFMRRAASAALVMLKGRAGNYWTIAEVGCRVAPPWDTAVEVAISPLIGGKYWKVTAAPQGADPIGSITLVRGSPRR